MKTLKFIIVFTHHTERENTQRENTESSESSERERTHRKREQRECTERERARTHRDLTHRENAQRENENAYAHTENRERALPTNCYLSYSDRVDKLSLRQKTWRIRCYNLEFYNN